MNTLGVRALTYDFKGTQLFSSLKETILQVSYISTCFLSRYNDSLFLVCPFKVVGKQIALEDRDSVPLWRREQFYFLCSLIKIMSLS